MDDALFRIEWNRHDRPQQQTMMEASARPTLTQTPAYIAALADAGHAHGEFGLMRFHERPIGYVFAERRPLFGRVSSYRIYRGPLWLDADLPGNVQREFFRLIRNRFRLRNGRPLTFHPELEDSQANRNHVSATGFRRIAHGYATIWLDTGRPLGEIRDALQQKWRNRLNQSERNGLELVVDSDGGQLDWLVSRHEEHMAAHRYQGPSRALLESLTRHGADQAMVRILVARKDSEAVAGVLIVRHGNSATYLIGWNGPSGRRLRAHNFLLWQAIRLLHEDGVRWFDLGGINDADAARVARFKAGISGTRSTLVGAYT